MKGSQNTIEHATSTMRRGGIVIFPTDTAYGIGCRIDRPDSVDRLFTIRRRSREQAMPVLVDSIDMALAYFDMPSDIVRHMMTQYWPGALTVVAQCKKKLIYSPIRGGGENIGLRMPDYKTVLEIIKRVGVPILGSSANFHGELTPYSTGDLNPEIIRLVDYVMPGECTVKQSSTVVDCSMNPYTIIRQGAVTL